MQSVLSSAQGQMKDENDIYGHAHAAAAQFKERLQTFYPDVDADKAADAFEDEARQRLYGQKLAEAVQAEHQYLNSGILGRRGHLQDIASTLDFTGLSEGAQARDFNDAASKIGTGQATERAYQVVAQHIARMQYDQSAGSAQRMWDKVSKIPAQVAGWMALSGVAKLGGSAVGAAEGNLTQQVLFNLGAGATRAAVTQRALGEALSRASPTVGLDEAGHVVQAPGESFWSAYPKSLAGDVLQNAAFEAAGTLGPRTEAFTVGNWAKGTVKGLAATELPAEAEHYLGLGGPGGSFTRYTNAKTDEERQSVLTDFAQQAVIFGVLEAGMGGLGAYDRAKIKAAADQSLSEARRQALLGGWSKDAGDRMIARGLARITDLKASLHNVGEQPPADLLNQAQASPGGAETAFPTDVSTTEGQRPAETTPGAVEGTPAEPAKVAGSQPTGEKVPAEAAIREGEIAHIPDYKELGPLKSSFKEGMRELSVEGKTEDKWFWDGDKADPSAVKGQMPKKGLAFIHDRETFLQHQAGAPFEQPPQWQQRTAGEAIGRSQFPTAYDPSLKEVRYNGSESDPEFAKIKERLAEINKNRADPTFGHGDAKPPVELTAIGQKKATPPGRDPRWQAAFDETGDVDHADAVLAQAKAKEHPPPEKRQVTPLEEKPSAPPTPAVEPEVKQPGPNPAFDNAQRKIAGGMRLSNDDIAAVFKAANLSPVEQHVLEQRLLHGRSHGDIAGDPQSAKEDGTPRTRQSVKQIEQSALSKMGLDAGSVASVVHDAEKAERAAQLAQEGRGDEARAVNAHPDDVAGVVKRKIDKITAAENQLDALTDQYIKEAEGGDLSQERKDFYASEFSRIRASTEAEPQPAEGEPTGVRQPFGETPVRRSPAGAVPAETRTPESDVAPAETVEPATGEPGATPAASERGPADSDQLIPDTTKARLAALHASGDEKAWAQAKDALRRNFDDPAGRQEADDFIRSLGNQKITKRAIPLKTPSLGHQAEGSHRVYAEDLLMQQERLEHELQKEIPGYSSAAEDAEAIRRGLQRGQVESQAEDVGRETNAPETGGGKPVGPEPADFAFGANAPAAAGPAPGTPGAAPTTGPGAPGGTGGGDPTILNGVKAFLSDESGALDLNRVKEFGAQAYDKVKKTFQGVSDELAKLSSKMVPALTRADRESGEKAGTMAKARDAGTLMAPEMIDKVFGPKSTPEERKLYGSAFLEEGFRTAKMNHNKEAMEAHQAAQALSQRAAATADPAEKARLEDAAKAETERAQASQKKRDAVTTAIGASWSSLPDEQTYQNTLADPKYQQAMRNYEKYFVPVMENNYRLAEGLDDNEDIHAVTQIPGRPLNRIALREGDTFADGSKVPPKVGPPEPASDEATPSGSARGRLQNLKMGKLGFARQAELSHANYEPDLGRMIENTLQKGNYLAAKADWLRTMVKNGVADFGTPGQKIDGVKEIPFVSPPKGTQAAGPGETSLYVPEGHYSEVRQLLQVDQPASRLPLTGWLTKVALASSVEFVYHGKNLFTGAMLPGVSPVDLLTDAYRAVSGDKSLNADLIRLAQVGVDVHPDKTAGALLPEAYAKLDPTYYMGKILEGTRKVMQSTLDKAFDRLVKTRDVPDTATARRDFINQLGNYDRSTQQKLVVLLRDLGIGDFATAGSNYYLRGLRSLAMDPGVNSTTWKGATMMRGEMLAKTLAVLGSVGVANYLMWGNILGDDKTPLGAIKTGTNAKGQTSYFDLTSLIGLTRGLRATGALAMLQGHRTGEPTAKSADKATDDIIHSLLHPALGPPAQFAYTAATGKNTLGMKVAPQVSTAKTALGMRQAAAKGMPPPGSSQAWQNVLAALKNANPAIGTLTGWNRPGQDVGIPQKVGEMMGPFGMKYSAPPKKLVKKK